MSLDVYLLSECFEANITHNLTGMAQEAGIYLALWRPEEIGITSAEQLIPLLQAGLTVLEQKPERFRKHEPANKWGSYEGLVDFVRRYLKACRENPYAEIRTSR